MHRRHKEFGGDIAERTRTVVERSISGDEWSGPQPPPSGPVWTVARWDRTARDMGECQAWGCPLRQAWWVGPAGPVGAVLLFVGEARCVCHGDGHPGTSTRREATFPPQRFGVHAEAKAS
jgi:hypothetical protein